MNREQHLKWSKDRANHYLNDGNTQEAFVSFLSDMSKHEELSNHKAIEMGMMLKVGGMLNTVDEMSKWINGFN